MAIRRADLAPMMAVVLARGLGRRMRADADGLALDAAQRAAADAGAKVMMPVGEGTRRPFVDFALRALAGAGCTEACLVVAPRHEALRAHVAASPDVRVRVHFAVQPAATGTAAAVLAAESVVGHRPFLVVNGDNLYPRDAIRALIDLQGCGLAAFTRAALASESGFDEARVARFATVAAASGWLLGLREKPPAGDVGASGPEALVSMNLWRFDPSLFGACRDVALSVRGEYELPDAVMLAVARGTRFRVLVARGTVLDLTSRSDIGHVSRRLAALEPRA